MSMQSCKIGPIMAISWQREKTEAIFKWRLWIRRILQSEAKNCVKNLKSWTLQFPHASGFLLFIVLRLHFWRTGLRFFSERFLFSLVHIITAAAAFSVWVRLERGDVLCPEGQDFAKTCSSATHTVRVVLLEACPGVHYLSSPRWFYAPTLVYILNSSFQVPVLSGHLGKASKRKCVTSS